MPWNFQGDDGIARLCRGEHGFLLALEIGIPVFVFHKDFHGSCGFPFLHLAAGRDAWGYLADAVRTPFRRDVRQGRQNEGNVIMYTHSRAEALRWH